MELPIYSWNPDPKPKKGKKRTNQEENLMHLYRWLRKPVLPTAQPLAPSMLNVRFGWQSKADIG